MDPDIDRTALLRAHATLSAGCAFVAMRAGQEEAARTSHPAHARMTGNRLHELDRFLSVLIDEAASLRTGPRRDARFFARMRNTPEKLRRLGSAAALHGAVGQRLGAIGRVCAYLRHCGDGVHRSGLAHDMRLAGGRADQERPTAEASMAMYLEPPTIVAIAGLYRFVGDALIGAVDGTAP
ncbi:hypothetical protein GG804_15855 [Sphingomonas histidinilytica]|uniref:Uncharacterized protein n=1 Tax=Rhizorhabdus histidinilytica TaxID=439228 RepID=A0A1T4ZQ70_9SPHN|nr:hypothetical protein [Rhizorhabdus histidinilytica]MBO9378244.1 hypothetical protein [Rhizorhabdus histidinilytica]QEH78820.1 hypothetical protein EIK56_11920 [Sphingomonas sp. C8-2]SKB24931.1 hypothetical protein SAMN06295920_10126 [Rhizorhabdus histidinilytica]